MKTSPSEKKKKMKPVLFLTLLFALIGVQACDDSIDELPQSNIHLVSSSSESPRTIKVAFKSKDGSQRILANGDQNEAFDWVISMDVLSHYLQRYSDFNDPNSIEIYPTTIGISKLVIVTQFQDEPYLSAEGWDHNEKKRIFTRVKLNEEHGSYFLANVKNEAELKKIPRDISWCESPLGETPCEGFSFLPFEKDFYNDKGEMIFHAQGINVSCKDDCNHTFDVLGIRD